MAEPEDAGASDSDPAAAFATLATEANETAETLTSEFDDAGLIVDQDGNPTDPDAGQ